MTSAPPVPAQIYNVTITLEGVWTHDKKKFVELMKKLSNVVSEAVNLTPEDVFEGYDRLDLNIEEAE